MKRIRLLVVLCSQCRSFIIVELDMDAEDVLGDTIGLFGDEVAEDDTIHYGPLALTTAPKVSLL